MRIESLTDASVALPYIKCRRGGLSIAQRFRTHKVCHFPSCVARNHTVVEPFSAPPPTDALYTKNHDPHTNLPRLPTAVSCAVEERATPAPLGRRLARAAVRPASPSGRTARSPVAPER